MFHFSSIVGAIRGTTAKVRNSLNSRFRKRTVVTNTAYVAESGEVSNNQGLSTLPDELLLQILDYFPPFIPPTSKFGKGDAGVAVHNTRRIALRALSQTCQNLRRFFLPYAWEYLELYRGICLPGRIMDWPSEKQNQPIFARALDRQLDLVTIDMPDLAASVRCIDVTITDFEINHTLKRLAQCLALFPNLHTIKLYYANGEYNITPAKAAFQNLEYPQVKRVIVSNSFYPLISSCMETRIVESIDAHIDARFVKYSAPCSKLESLICPAGFRDLDLIRLNHPLLRDINFYIYFRVEYLPSLLQFQHLRKLKISRMEPEDDFTSITVPVILSHLSELQNRDGEEKSLWVHYMMFRAPDDVYTLHAPPPTSLEDTT